MGSSLCSQVIKMTSIKKQESKLSSVKLEHR
uniref:Uncharacterized protein n=1 Tax=Anguilla anguilla TaxID=7936 RepID=A0A0E9PIC0_ANGAN